MNKALSGLHVLVTRPDPAGSVLCQKIIALGGKALHYPTLAFAPPNNTAALKAALTALPKQDWLIFISPQAVAAALPMLNRDALKSVKLACVGGATAQALMAAGWTVAATPDTDWSSEGLLQLPAFQAPRGLRVAVMRGEGGREKIDHVLAHRGAHVLPVKLYQRVLPTVSDEKQAAITHALQDGCVNVILGASFLSVQHLKTLVGVSLWPLLKTIPLIVMSHRIETLVRALGFTEVQVSEAASEAAIIQLLVKERDSLCQKK